jgi:hypothetical protein
VTDPGRGESIGRYYPDHFEPQAPAEVAVLISTLQRPCLSRAIESVYRQTFSGRIQILVGVDKREEPAADLDAIFARRPNHISGLVLAPPYSTSVRHGGIHSALDGGAMRTLLSFLANARFVAYLDDDNTYEPDHLAGLLRAVQGKVWAHSQRMIVDEQTDQNLAVDRWDSVGPGRGRFASIGGFVDTNCLLVDKVAATRALGRWSESGTGEPGLTADRNFFAAIKDAPHGRVDRPTIRYRIRPTNILHRFIRERVEF